MDKAFAHRLYCLWTVYPRLLPSRATAASGNYPAPDRPTSYLAVPQASRLQHSWREYGGARGQPWEPSESGMEARAAADTSLLLSLPSVFPLPLCVFPKLISLPVQHCRPDLVSQPLTSCGFLGSCLLSPRMRGPCGGEEQVIQV